MQIKVKAIKQNVGYHGQVIADGVLLIDGKISADFYYVTGKKDVNLTVDSDDLDFYGLDYKAALQAVTDELEKGVVAVKKKTEVHGTTSVKSAKKVAIKGEVKTNKQKMFEFIQNNKPEHCEVLQYGKKIGIKDIGRTLRSLKDNNKIKKIENTWAENS